MSAEIAVVEAVYDAFARADVGAILRLFRPDATVQQSPAVPWGGSYEGHDGLLQFLATLSGAIATTPVHEHLFADGAGHVVQVGVTSGTARATGTAFSAVETHVWTVRDGQVARFEVYLDVSTLPAELRTR